MEKQIDSFVFTKLLCQSQLQKNVGHSQKILSYPKLDINYNFKFLHNTGIIFYTAFETVGTMARRKMLKTPITCFLYFIILSVHGIYLSLFKSDEQTTKTSLNENCVQSQVKAREIEFLFHRKMSTSIEPKVYPNINLEGDTCLEYLLNGTTFQETSVIQNYNKVKVCHLKTFGEEIVEDCRKRFLNANDNIRLVLKSPSLLWIKSKLYISLRIKIIGKPDCWGFRCNHLYLREYDDQLNPVEPGEMITVLTPITTKTKYRTGIHDARLFAVNNRMYGVFSTGFDSGWISVIWDFKQHRHFIPEFQKKALQNKSLLSEKNWVPMIIEDELYIIRHLDPLQILKCRIHEDCTLIENNTINASYVMDEEAMPLRGGTPFILYKYPYYIGIGHGTYFTDVSKRYYEAHLIVMRVHPFRIVYVSDPLEIHKDLYSRVARKSTWIYVQGEFIFPIGLLIESEDSLVIGAHVNDRVSVLLRLDGIKGLFQNVRKWDNDAYHWKIKYSIQEHLLRRAQTLNLSGKS